MTKIKTSSKVIKMRQVLSHGPTEQKTTKWRLFVPYSNACFEPGSASPFEITNMVDW